MNIRADVAELLHAGHPNIAIARQLHIDHRTVSEARRHLGMPKAARGRRAAATPEDLFWRRTQPTDDGHLLWTGHRNNNGVPCLRHGGRGLSAYRIAFRIKHGRDPIGHVKSGCGVEGCVHPRCVEDRPTREANRRADKAFDAIFGTPA